MVSPAPKYCSKADVPAQLIISKGYVVFIEN